jgi:hypothetical protein
MFKDSKMSMAESGGRFSGPSATLAERRPPNLRTCRHRKTIRGQLSNSDSSQSTPVPTLHTDLDHVLTSNPFAAPRSPRGPQPRLRVRAHRLQHLLGQLAHLEDVANVTRQTRRIAHKEPGCFPTSKRNEGPKFRQEAV